MRFTGHRFALRKTSVVAALGLFTGTCLVSAADPRPQDQSAKQLSEIRTDFIRQRAAFRALRERDEKGLIATGAKLAAVARLNEMLARPLQESLVAFLPVGSRQISWDGQWLAATAGLNPAHTLWRSLGPANVGGRTRSVLVLAPPGSHDPKIWLASAGGGIWSNFQGAISFSPADDLMANLAISCMAVNPKNSNVVYAGTGEGFYNNDALRGGGIFRTVDGKKWERLQATANPQFSFVNRIAISSDGNVLLAAARASTGDDSGRVAADPGATPPMPGIMRSDDTEHAKWSRVLDAEIADVKFHPTDRLRAVAGGLYTGQAYYSSDAGLTWKLASHGPWGGARVELTFATKSPSVVYASVDVNKGEVWRSDDFGKTYAPEVMNSGDGSPIEYLGKQGWYDNSIWAGDPDNDELVVVGGINLWKREKRGGPFVQIGDWTEDGSAHSDVHSITSDSQYKTTKTLYVGTDGGLFRGNIASLGSDKKRHPWEKLTNGYCVTQFYDVAGDSSGTTIIAGAQDNGTLRYTAAQGAAHWSTMFGGDGGSCAFDDKDPKYCYGEYVWLSIHRSTDGGENSEFISGQADWDEQKGEYNWKPPPYLIPDARDRTALFIAPFVLDPSNGNRLLAGGVDLWQTENARAADGPSWFSIKDGVYDKNGHISQISSIAVFKSDNPKGSNIVWVGHRDGQLFNSTDTLAATASHWNRVDRDTNGLQVLPERFCTNLAVDRHNDKVCYATFGGYSTGNVWKTADFGAHWVNLGASLPAAPVNSITTHPNNPSYIYVGTDVGVFASEDGGANWSPTNEGPTNCAVFNLRWMGTTLLAATHGRGLFAIDLATVPVSGGTP